LIFPHTGFAAVSQYTVFRTPWLRFGRKGQFARGFKNKTASCQPVLKTERLSTEWDGREN